VWEFFTHDCSLWQKMGMSMGFEKYLCKNFPQHVTVRPPK
jgi:hypothetical protein